jgi:hypothetical protein
MNRAVVVLAVAVSLASTPMLSAQSGSGEASLKAAHQLLVQSVNSGNLALLGNVVHPRALGFFRDSQMLVQLGGSYTTTDVVPAVVADLSRFTTIPYDTVFRVSGDVGVVCMTAYMQTSTVRVEDRYVRTTYVYARVDGNWRLLSWHSSDIPLAK